MINTYNESQLHKTLKLFFAARTHGTTEVPYKNFILDIVAKDGSVIEIQSASLSALKEKVRLLLADKKRVTIVTPLVIEKRIETYSTENPELWSDKTLLSSRKSPKKESVYSKLREMTGLVEFMTAPDFEVIFVDAKVIEQRVRAAEKTDTPNKARRFYKDWVKVGKRLAEFESETSFCGKNAWLGLLPESLRDGEFSSKDVKKELKRGDAKYAGVLLWVLSRAGMIECVRKDGNLKVYCVRKR